MASSSCLPWRSTPSQQFPAFFAFLLLFLLFNIPPVNARAAQFYASAAANHTTNITLSALLAFKNSITADPTNFLASWDRRTPASYCTWPGVLCSDGTQIVTSLLLHSRQLYGPITPQLGYLPHLSYLDISNNSFFGGIPPELGKLTSLTHLDLGSNNLAGSIPVSLTNCTRISYLDFSLNFLIGGSIPPELGKLTSLTHLGLHNNRLSGSIPVSLSNCTHISYLDFSLNQFISGSIPQELGKLTSLTHLALGFNSLEGSIPVSLTNCTHLQYLDLSANALISSESLSFIITFHHLVHLGLSFNTLNGSVPPSITNCTNLAWLDLSGNKLSGELPSDWSKLAMSLQLVSLDQNRLTGRIPVTLGNCTMLILLSLAYNSLTGEIPEALGKLTLLQYFAVQVNSISGAFPPAVLNCTKLIWLTLGDNNISGSIPQEIGKLTQVQLLAFRNNSELGGRILDAISGCAQLSFLYLGYTAVGGGINLPSSLFNLSSLQYLSLSSSGFSGTLSEKIRNLTILSSLYLDHNAFEGKIPEGLGELKSLQLLDLSYNSLSGTIPFISSAYITSLRLSYNNLTGTLPSSWNSTMQEISLSNNHFKGTIPRSLGACQGLIKLDLSVNELNGEIPKTFGINLKSLQYLDLSQNQLSGALPLLSQPAAGDPFFNFSFNAFQGMIPNIEVYSTSSPDCFIGNPRLCGQPLSVSCGDYVAAPRKLSRSHASATAVVSIALGVFVLVAIFCACFWWWWNSSSKKCKTKDFRPKTIIAWTALEVRAATNDFDGANVIGSGAVSVCYKGVMEDGGDVVAVKIFNSFELEARESFVNELKTLGYVKHRHLVKVLGYCVAHEGVALVMEFMEQGDLDENLHSAQKCLSWKERVQVAIDVAKGLIYLHHEYDQPIIHCDLKPTNILLGSDMVAKISDFGIAMLLDMDQSKGFSMSKFKGTFGYVAPELASGSRISTKVDVYSYGVLLMEMVTGIRPTSEKLLGVDLHGWVQKFYNAKRTKEIVDEALQEAVTREPAIVQEAEVLLDIGLRCSNERPKERPTMRDVQNLLVGLRKERSIHYYPDLQQLLQA